VRILRRCCCDDDGDEQGLLAALDINYEAANTRFVERLGNYRIRTAGAYSRKVRVGDARREGKQDEHTRERPSAYSCLSIVHCRPLSMQVNLMMEEEGTAQDVLDLIKWRTACHFFFEDESEPFIERETVLMW